MDTDMDFGLNGLVVTVTGGGSGIGAQTARSFAALGAKVAVVDRNREGAQAVRDAIAAAGGVAAAYAADVTDETSVTDTVARIQQELGAVSVLVNNAGFTRDMKITKMSVADWDSVIDVVLKGAFLCSRAVLPAMAEAGYGRIVNISSRAHLGNPGQANYSSAKAGIIGFTRALSLEWGRHNITINAVAPGIINTAAVTNLPHYQKIKESAERTTPISRIGETEDVANAIVFLGSRLASYITGETLHVTGGRY
jgi:3-oxoacyl-[acyl-carrier protein] reductase